MSSGKHHAMASVAVATAMILPAILYSPENSAVVIGCFLGVLITPDLDIENPIYSHYTMGKIGRYAGRIFEFLFRWTWRLFWYPYSVFIPRHRHWTSHFPVIGTLGRLAYMGVYVAVIVAFYPFILDYLYSHTALRIVVGLMISDTIHWVMDGLPIYT